LRKRSATELKRALAKLDKARAEWRRFEEEDRPCFSQWMAATFGAHLTEFRENARKILEQQNLIEAVEMEMMWGNHRNPRKAYAAVIRRQENPEPEADHTRSDESERSATPEGHGARARRDDEENGVDDRNPYEEMGADFPEEKRQAMFEDFLKSVFGINPKRMDREEYATMFAHFEAEVFGKGRQGGRIGVNQGAKPVAGREETRIKEIYRTLVRRLHPDKQADEDKKVSAIWHEVQEAYATRNLDRLESLLALTEIQGGTTGGDASLSQLEGALAEIQRGLRAIQRSIREAKYDPAWRFSRGENRIPVEKRVRREMEQSIAEQRWVLADLKRTLDD
jgi:hypothetical protein